MSEFLTKIRVVLGAVPAWGAAIVGILTALQAQVIPLLPEEAAVQATAWIATVLAQIAAIVAAVARVTPVAESAIGLLPKPATKPTPE